MALCDLLSRAKRSIRQLSLQPSQVLLDNLVWDVPGLRCSRSSLEAENAFEHVANLEMRVETEQSAQPDDSEEGSEDEVTSSSVDTKVTVAQAVLGLISKMPYQSPGS